MHDNPSFDPSTQLVAPPKYRRQLPQRHVDRLLGVLANGQPLRSYRIEDALRTGEHWRVYDTCCALADEGLLVRSQDRSGVDLFALPAPTSAELAPSTPVPPPSSLETQIVPAALAGASFIRLVAHEGIPQAPLVPQSPNWMQTDDLAVVAHWIACGANLGLLLRDLVVLDVDPKHAVPATATTSRDANIAIADSIRSSLEARGLPPTLTQRTRSGGLHFLYRARPKVRYDELPWPELRGDGGPLVECRSGGHRWIVLTPSKFRPPLAPVRWLRQDVLAEAPDWLPCHTWTPPPRHPLPTAEQLAAAQVKAELSTLVDFQGQLDTDGWTRTRHPGGYWLLVRPGKRPHDGASATLDKVAPGVLHVFSTAAPLPVGNYDAFSYLTAVHFDGDVLAALSALERPR